MDVLHACLQLSPCMTWHACKYSKLNAFYMYTQGLPDKYCNTNISIERLSFICCGLLISISLQEFFIQVLHCIFDEINRGGFLMDVLHACLQSSPCMTWHACKTLTSNPTIKGCQIHIVIQTFELKH